MRPASDNIYCLAFCRIPEIGPARFRKIKKYFGTFEKAWRSSKDEFAKIAGFKNELLLKISQAQKEIDPEKEWTALEKLEISFLTADQENFPSQLKQISSAPFVLFCKGDIQTLSSKQISIIGARTPTQYGKTAAQKITSELASAGLVITSGMANGIDRIAHMTTLSCNQKTIAVLGSGIQKRTFSSFDKNFVQQITESGGCIVSEYYPTHPATRFTFPARNRIISGLSVGILIVEAGEKSGSLITARYGLEAGKEIFAIPGSIFSEKSSGTNTLIKQGAQLVTSSKDIFEALNFSFQENPKEENLPNFADPEEEKVYSKLSFEPIHIDRLAKNCKMDSSLVLVKISSLELGGFIKNIGGGMFIKKE